MNDSPRENEPGTNLLSRCHYHRPQLLNFCVRDGNRCIQSGICTGKSVTPICDPPAHQVRWEKSHPPGQVLDLTRRSVKLGVQQIVF